MEGKGILQGNLRIPSWTEMAVSLGRTPRFSGRTEAVWTDLHHSLVVEAIAGAMVSECPKKFRENVSLYAVLHDAHEYWTGDIPTPFKTDAIREMQREMDRQLRAAHRIPEPPAKYHRLIKEADNRALAAEATLVRPDRYFYFEVNSGRLPVPEPQDLEIVHLILSSYGTPHYTMYPDSPAVESFVRMVEAGILAVRK